MSEDDPERMRVAFQRHFDHRERYDGEFRMVNKQGELRWFRVRGQYVRDDQVRPIRMGGSIQDVTDNKALVLSLSDPANPLKEQIHAKEQLEVQLLQGREAAFDRTIGSGHCS